MILLEPEVNRLRTTLAQALREQNVDLNRWKFHELTEQWPWLGECYRGAECPSHPGLWVRTNLDFVMHLHDQHPDWLLVVVAGWETLRGMPELPPGRKPVSPKKPLPPAPRSEMRSNA